MTQKQDLNPLRLVASLLFAATLLVSVFLLTRLSTASAQEFTHVPAVASAPNLAGARITAAGAYTLHLPLIFVSRPVTFYDGFSDPDSGWRTYPLNLAEPDPPGPWSSGYGKEVVDKKGSTIDQDVYNVKTVAAWNSWIYTSPVVLANPADFEIWVDGKSAQDFMWASSWGLYFNANADRTQFYTFQIFQNSDGESYPTFEVRRWDYFQGDADDPNLTLIHKACKSCARADFEWTQIRVRRSGSWIEVHAGGRVLAGLYAPDYTTGGYNGVGLYQGNFEWNDSHPRRYGLPTFQFDNFWAWPVWLLN